MTMKQIVITGIQPSGKLHIGNYIGAIKTFLTIQNNKNYQPIFFVADYHSITETYDFKEKQNMILDLIVNMLALGLDTKKTLFFLQSLVPAHTELAWLLNCFTPLGEAKRMTQFKEKSEHQPENINLGLLTYPVLMAADILLYDAQLVTIGDDQLQHLELTRTLARKFNSKFGKTFIEPQPLLTLGSRIMNLNNPLKKMSKSTPNGCLFLDDPPNIIETKIKSAVTDSGHEIKYDPTNKAAISNLIAIYHEITGLDIKKIEKKFSNKSYLEFKKDLINQLIKFLQPFQANKKLLLKKQISIKKLIKEQSKKANKIANKKLQLVKKKIGLNFS
ncbi:MAG: tryptophan--tRNA ligase [Minisyncoccia bacterium]